MNQTDVNPTRRNGRKMLRGFTLLELMVTISVAGVLLALAIPSFQRLMASNQLTTTGNNMIEALNLARMQAIKRGGDAQFCGKTNSGGGDLSTACNADSPSAVYVLVGSTSSTTAELVRSAPEIPADSIKLQTVNAIRFSAQGLGHVIGAAAPYNGTVATICSESIGSDNVRTITMTTGSILESTESTGSCP